MKKLLKRFVIIFTIISIFFSSVCFAETNFKEQVKKEDGSLFEKIIAECIGGLAQTIFDFTTSKEANVGFKDYDQLIFNKVENSEETEEQKAQTNISPFTSDLWNKTMKWYKVFAIISGILILIAVIILSYKIMYAGMNISAKNEAKDSLMRLCFGRCCNSLSSFIY